MLRSGRGAESLVNLSDVSIRRTFNPLRTMRCSFLFRFLVAPVVAAVVSHPFLFRVEFVLVAVLEDVGVAIHGVDESSRPGDQMRYAILWRVCRRYTMS